MEPSVFEWGLVPGRSVAVSSGEVFLCVGGRGCCLKIIKFNIILLQDTIIGTLLEPLSPSIPVLGGMWKFPSFGSSSGRRDIGVCGVLILWGMDRTCWEDMNHYVCRRVLRLVVIHVGSVERWAEGYWMSETLWRGWWGRPSYSMGTWGGEPGREGIPVGVGVFFEKWVVES